MENLSTEELQSTFQSLVDITLCSICLETVRPEMVQCVNGHLICSDCRGELETCPTCRDTFSNDKPSGIITQIVEALPPRCHHKNCGRYINRNDDDHQVYCGFRLTQCKFVDCEWNGCSQDILQHVIDEHNEMLFEKESDVVTLNDFNVDENISVVYAWYIHSQFFWHEIVNNAEKKQLIHSFVSVPIKKPKNKFYVKAVSTSKDMKFKVKIKLSLDPNVTTEDTNYISIPKFMLPQFVDDESNLTSHIAFKTGENRI
ncbi:E3 ubiquitin-protein ligase Siah2-like [Homalodisca vitripennis]|uniref:E3 ubiquitin-protein ligase Siah2-like n=1 Tax=Homalodisca vitripennis TaxID=197043 RepID=UPI001EE9F936|nr:E3 ubiquitin-protein ligase Siah2-like [Homalodisca vitripennis]